jgi:hypothetical protein
MSETAESHAGGCACGEVRYRVAGALRPVVACHCSQCRKSFTNYAAFSAARRGDLTIDDPAAVCWYSSSPGVRRGFCRRCGSALFWDKADNDFVSLAAGSLDQPSGLRQVRHIYAADKADFYEIADGLEVLPQGQGDDTWPQALPAGGGS